MAVPTTAESHMEDRKAIVLGAGAVGISCAVSLQDRGFRVSLVDRRGPAEEASHGNAGIITPDSFLPVLSKDMLPDLPLLMAGCSPKVRVNPFYAAREARALGMMALRATDAHARHTAASLAPLIRASIGRHRELAGRAGSQGLLRDKGWLHLYRRARSFGKASGEREAMLEHGVRVDTLSKDDIRDLEPAVRPVFEKGIWIRDGLTCVDPGRLLKSYAALFTGNGGELARREAESFGETGEGCEVRYRDGETESCDLLVVALGPWSKPFLAKAGIDIPLLMERGYHMHFAPAGDVPLGRPFLDADRGYVVNPMEKGLRVTTGTELNFISAPPSHAQVRAASRSLREALPVGEQLDREPWMGRRPTLPDSLPAIGHAKGLRRTILAFGHQHVGFTTGPGTGEIVAAVAAGENPPADAAPFDPARL